LTESHVEDSISFPALSNQFCRKKLCRSALFLKVSSGRWAKHWACRSAQPKRRGWKFDWQWLCHQNKPENGASGRCCKRL